LSPELKEKKSTTLTLLALGFGALHLVPVLTLTTYFHLKCYCVDFYKSNSPTRLEI